MQPEPDSSIDLAAFDVNQNPARFTESALAGGPVQWSERHRGWLMLSHQAVSAAFRDGRLSADRVQSLRRRAVDGPLESRANLAKVAELLAGWMIFRDPPAHTHLRDPVRRAVTPKVVDGLRPTIAATIDRLIDDLPDGEFDLRHHFAEPLPALVIADLLGVPGSERQRFKQWSDRLGELVFSVQPGSVPTDDVADAVDEFTAFFGRLIDRRRADPGHDLVSRMVTGGADNLTAMELVGACTLLLFAGHETTTNMLVSAVHLLHGRPEDRQRLVEDASIDTTAADELLRVAGPAKAMVRRVGPEPFEVNGASLEPGQRVFLVILTANHDPDVFDEPARVDLGREPNLHLGFGWGLHHCLGAPLARMELTMALRALYRARPGLGPVEPDRPWSGNELGRGIGRMTVAG
jgi:cytochrome P450